MCSELRQNHEDCIMQRKNTMCIKHAHFNTLFYRKSELSLYTSCCRYFEQLCLSLLVLLNINIHIMKTYLYNFDPLKPHFYIVKLGFTGVYIIFSYFCSKTYIVGTRWNSLGEVVLTSTHNLSFKQKYEKISEFFYLKIFGFWRWNFLYIWIGVFS